MQQSQPECFFLKPELIDPDGVVNQQEHLTNAGQEPTKIGDSLIFTENKKRQGELQGNEGAHGQELGVDFLIEPAGKEAHKDNAEVDNTAQEAKLSLVHIVVSLELLSTGGKDAVVEIDEDISEGHEGEDGSGGFAVVFAFSNLVLHEFFVYNGV